MTNMKSKPLFTLVLGFSVLGALSACDGGLDIADGGIRGTGDSVGPVSGFGSVFVNGIRFDTSALNGEITGNDGIDTEALLEKGMIVRVEGEWDENGEGVATALEYDDTLRGEISGLTIDQDRDRLTFTIYGQTIHADAQTVFRGTSMSALQNGQFVRVSAWPAENGYRASFVGRVSDADDTNIEIEGTLDDASLDINLNTFLFNGQRILYTDSSLATGGITESALGEGRQLEIEGAIMNGAIIASTIRPSDSTRFQGEDGSAAELAGPASPVDASEGLYRIAGQLVELQMETELSGLKAEELGDDLLVKVEGEIRDGVLVAKAVERRESSAKVEAAITQVPDLSNQKLEVGGIPILITASTLIADGDDEMRLTLERLQLGDRVEVNGIEKLDSDGNTFLEATKIERSQREIDEDDVPDWEARFELRGNLQQLTLSDLTILGVTLNITDNTELTNATTLVPGSLLTVDYRTLPQGVGFEALTIRVDKAANPEDQDDSDCTPGGEVDSDDASEGQTSTGDDCGSDGDSGSGDDGGSDGETDPVDECTEEELTVSGEDCAPNDGGTGSDEECLDDGRTVAGEECNTDGDTDSGEACLDDGRTDSGEECSADGDTGSGEECLDDGRTDSGEECPTDGDTGSPDDGSTDGETDSGDSCTTDDGSDSTDDGINNGRTGSEEETATDDPNDPVEECTPDDQADPDDGTSDGQTDSGDGNTAEEPVAAE